MALATNAMQLASMLPMLNATLQRTNAELAKIMEAGEANQQLYRSLADPFGRRSALEAARARDVMSDALLADPEDDGARLVLGFAYLRLGLRAAAAKQLSTLADRFGPCQVIALSARGHLRSIGWAGSDAATRKLGGADLAKALAFKPRQADAGLFRGLVNWHETKWGQAESDLQAANKLKPDDVDGLWLLACFYAAYPGADRKLADAEAAADRACTLTNQQDAACLEALAAVQARRGDWEKAEATQRQAVAVAIGDLAVRAENRLAAIRAKQPPAKALPLVFADAGAPREPAAPKDAKELDSLLELPGPGVAPNWRERVRILIRHEKWGPAANNLANVLDPQVVTDDWFQYGCLLWLAGDKAGYQALCQRAIAGGTERAARLASVTPDSGLLPAQLLQVATRPNRLLDLRPQNNFESVHGLSLAQYRAGDYNATRKTIDSFLTQQAQFAVPEAEALMWQVVALTHAQVANLAPAREAANRARALMPDPLPQDFPTAGLVGIWLAYQVQGAELDRLMGRDAIEKGRPAPVKDDMKSQLAAMGGRFVSKGHRSTWSPDGQKLAFGRTGGDDGIEILSLDTGKIAQVATVGKDPSWSGGKGAWIAYVRPLDGIDELRLVSAQGGESRKIASGGFPSWSADGLRVFFFSGGKLSSLGVENEAPYSQIRDHMTLPYPYPAVSPDGNLVAYKMAGDLVVGELRTGKTVKRYRLPNGTGILGSWSPDGRRFAFGGWGPSDQMPSLILEIETGRAVQVATRSLTLPAWSPDGKQMAFDLRIPSGTEIWLFPTSSFDNLPDQELPSVPLTP
jgi:hypothetical protein